MSDIICSVNYGDFTLIYCTGDYSLYYYDILCLDKIKEPLNPKELYKTKYKEILTSFDVYFYNENKYNIFKILFDEIRGTIIEFKKNKEKIMYILRQLIKTLYFAFIDSDTNQKNCKCFERVIKEG